ncbi:MAG: hypothetical protein QCI38_09050, partial [Candidatus Thermoplasmatota archaeon]|nr:hypothetical protein [Candidatus Thermoplasmatota archaeon]
LAEIANLLYSRKIIDKPDPHFIRPYFNTMEEMDLVKRLPMHGKKEFMYMLKSPIMELGFMLDEKYNFFQQDISSHTMKAELASRTPLHVEQFCGELFAEAYDGRYEYFYTRDFDTDFIITRGSKVLAVGEVKWGEKAGAGDIDLFLERTKHLPGERILFSKKAVKDKRITSLTPENLTAWTQNRRR